MHPIKGDIEFVASTPAMPVFRSPVRCVSATKIYEALTETKIVISRVVLCTISDCIFKDHLELSNGTEIFFRLICTSLGCPAPLYAIFDGRRPLLDRHQTKCVGIGLDDIEREKLRILMLET